MNINSGGFWSKTWYEEIPYLKVLDESEKKPEEKKDQDAVDINIPFGWTE